MRGLRGGHASGDKPYSELPSVSDRPAVGALPQGEGVAMAGQIIRPFSELSDSGLLWLINRVVFHPRGYALAVDTNESGEATGWMLLGDGSEQWSFPVEDEHEKFRAAEATLRAAKEA